MGAIAGQVLNQQIPAGAWEPYRSGPLTNLFRDRFQRAWAVCDDAGQRASIHTDEHKQPGSSAEGSGQVRAGGGDVSASTRPKRLGLG
jgi:hypothetical protein